MKTVTIQIGNSDDKLTQAEWSAFVGMVANEIADCAEHTHFFGTSSGADPWQNACWVIEIKERNTGPLRAGLAELRSRIKQDSIAWTEGETKFI